MRIVLSDSFNEKLDSQVDFIAEDSPQRARIFKNDLLARIKEIASNPWVCRKSIYSDEVQVRDLVFKGYVIVFRVTENTIVVFALVKYQEKL